MFTRFLCILTALLALTGPARAEFAKVDSQDEFIRLVSGKTLSRPFINLKVTPDGRIIGKGARWDVTGEWTWQDGFFCRSLYWGGDNLGYNCQAVHARGERLRFTSDEGAGRSADFSLE